MIPQFLWFSRQRAVKINQNTIRALVTSALPQCVTKGRYATSSLPSMIEVSFLNDRAIAKIHADFCNDPSPTDVITFRHSPELGEILIGVPTVVRHAKKFHQSVDHEVALCVIHGLLHLLDYDDIHENERLIMHQYQDFLLQYAVTANVPLAVLKR